MEHSLSAQRNFIAEGLSIVDAAASAMWVIQRAASDTHRGARARVSGLLTAKACNLLLGIHSLNSDGLGQESGALLRPFLECVELIDYIRVVPAGVTEFMEDRLPKAGVRAQAIGSPLQGLRQHLNEHASHISIAYDSMSHIVDANTGVLRVRQPACWNSFVTNLSQHGDLAVMLATSAVRALESVDPNASPVHAARLQAWSARLRTDCPRAQPRVASTTDA
jgi:hypothetical protein